MTMCCCLCSVITVLNCVDAVARHVLRELFRRWILHFIYAALALVELTRGQSCYAVLRNIIRTNLAFYVMFL
jgi:hypothetical protein